jgi:hypothetical protein
MKELCSEDENSYQSPMRMGPELFHELLQNINGCIMLAYTHIKEVIHLKIKLDEWYMVINYSITSYKAGLHISYLRNTLEVVYFSRPFYSCCCPFRTQQQIFLQNFENIFACQGVVSHSTLSHHEAVCMSGH